MSNGTIGLITEQGDMGLGFDPLSQEDQQVLKESRDDDEKEKSGAK